MSELSAIRAMRAMFTPCPRQKNALFTCDAELVELADVIYGLSMDEFSPQEDLLPMDDPEALGRNLAVAVISDILAAGCMPELYMHAVTLPRQEMEQAFGTALSQGVASVLSRAGCAFLGGDVGQAPDANTWRYTGFCMGRAGERGPLTRILPTIPQDVWITGTVGDGNAHALSGSMPNFELRYTEAENLRRFALAGIDTSGGLVDSLLLLSLCNPGHYLSIDSAAIPYAPEALATADSLNVPDAAFAFAGAGEYELLFTAPKSFTVCPFATRIGSVMPTAPTGSLPGVYWDKHKLPAELPDPRACASRKAYMQALLEVVNLCAR